MTEPSYVFSGYVHAGEIVSGATIDAYDDVTVRPHGAIFSTTIEAKGYAYISHDALARNTLVSGGTLEVSGTAIYTSVVGGGTLDINGGLARESFVASGGSQLIFIDQPDGVQPNAIDTLVGYGGAQRDYVGSVSSTTVLDGGVQQIDGGSADTLILGGAQLLDSGTATGVTVRGGGQVNASNNAVLAGTLQAGATLVIQGTDTDLAGFVVDSGATVVFLDGASAAGLALGAGVTVERGTVALYHQVGAASLIEGASDVFSGTLVGAGRTEIVGSGGVASATNVVNGGMQRINAGGVASATAVRDATQTINSGIAYDTAVFSGGYQVVSGGTAIGTILYQGGVQSAGASDARAFFSATTVSGGIQLVGFETTAVGTVIADGGTQSASFEATVSDTTIGAGGLQYIAGGDVTGSVVEAGGQLLDYANFQLVSGSVVESGGFFVLDTLGYTIGDAAKNVTIQSGGHLVVLGGAMTSGFKLDAGAIVTRPGVAFFSGTANSPGRYELDPHLSGSVLSSYTYQEVTSGGLVTSNTVQDLSGQYIYSGGVALGTTIEAGGEQFVEQGFVAQTEIQSGGRQFVAGHTTAIGTTIDAGGILFTSGTSIVSNVNFHVGGFLDLESLGFRSGGSVTLTDHNLLVVNEGGHTAAIQLVGDYTGEQFAKTYGFDGTLITLSAVQPAAATAMRSGELLPQATATGDLPAVTFYAPMSATSGAAHQQPLLAIHIHPA